MRLTLAGALSGLALLAASATPAAGQTPAGCGVITDAVVAQALGPSARAQAGGPIGGADACTVVGSGEASIGVLHVSSAFPAGRAVDPVVLLATMLQSLPSDDNVDVEAGGPSANTSIEATPVTGVGDAAVLIVQSAGSGTLDDLLVQRGAEGFSFSTSDSPGARDALIALAQAVVASR